MIVYIHDHVGITALMVCAGAYTTQKVLNAQEKTRILMDGGARPDIVNHQGDTALLLATSEGNHGVVKVLLDAGASCFDHDGDG